MARVKEALRADPQLYERDYYLWLEEQAGLLRAGRLDQLDVPSLLDEMEDMGRREKKSIKSALIVILLHLLKHEFQPRRRSRKWLASIVEHRQRMEDDLADSPSLRGHPQAVLADAYAKARERAIAETGLPPGTFPEASPYTVDQALDRDFLPG